MTRDDGFAESRITLERPPREDRTMHRTRSSLIVLTVLIVSIVRAFAPRRRLALVATVVLALVTVTGLAAEPDTSGDPALRALEWREIGPYRGGRSAAVTGIASQPEVFYFGSTGGGVWKTTDGGESWNCVSDGFFGGSIGAVAVSEWDPNVVYVGGGEKTVRGNVSHGDGIWKSTDAGKSWTHVGLADSRHVPRIRIHPRNPDRVWVAALGHLFGPNDERGIYRTDDGGKSWKRVLFVDDEVGAVDLALDPTNPRILYATFWRVRRTPWSLESGGDGSGIWKTTDGGDTWNELTGNKGLPRGTLGIIGIAVSPTDPQNLYAIVEAAEGGVFRSRDGGETWERTNQQRDLRQRAWYYTRIYADPADEESVYVVNVQFHHSKDGGKTFGTIRTPHGDNHDLWIAPNDPLRMIESNDGGANVSFDGGKTWTTQANQPTAQIYRVSVDSDFPYRLLGGQQDNTALRIRSRSTSGGAIGVRDWEPTAGGESGHVVAKPDDPDVVYGGSYGGFLVLVNHRTGERRAVNVWPDNPMGWGAAELKYRFQWNYPLFFSPHDPDTLYAAANVLFRSRDGGQSWEPISPDLTRDDKSKMDSSGGPITKDNTSVEYYGTIFAAVESPHEAGVLWAGSDDGLLHVSRDGGTSWSNVTPPGLPEWSQINAIDAHPFEKGGLYVAATRYKLDDFRPYLYRTTDYGKNWTEISSGIDPAHFTRVVRADPDRRGLLYAGTERGVYVSFDDGASWQSLQLELPVVPITDLAVHQGNLIAATQGRGFWILDDLPVLHQLTDEIRSASSHLFAPAPAYRLGGGRRNEPRNMGTNPPEGVVLHYLLATAPDPDTEMKLEIFEPDGDLVRRFTRKPPEDEAAKAKKKEQVDEEEGEEEEEPDDPRQLDAEAGLNRFVWDLRYPSAEQFDGLVLWNRNLDGPRAVPGDYRARLSVGDWSGEATCRVLSDPRSSATPDDFRAQFEFAAGLRDRLSEIHQAIGKIRDVRAQLDTMSKRLADDESAEPVRARAGELKQALTAVEEVLYQTKNQSPQDPLNFPIRLNDKLAGLMGLASFGDARPTASMLAVRDELFAVAEQQLSELQRILTEDVAAFNRLAREREVPSLIVP